MINSRVSIRAAWLLASVLLASPLALPSPARADDIFDFYEVVKVARTLESVSQ